MQISNKASPSPKVAANETNHYPTFWRTPQRYKRGRKKTTIKIKIKIAQKRCNRDIVGETNDFEKTTMVYSYHIIGLRR